MGSAQMGPSIYVAVFGEASDFDEHRNESRKVYNRNGVV